MIKVTPPPIETNEFIQRVIADCCNGDKQIIHRHEDSLSMRTLRIKDIAPEPRKEKFSGELKWGNIIVKNDRQL